jgi:hypothetical protein
VIHQLSTCHHPIPILFRLNIIYWKEGKLYHENKWTNFDTISDYNLYFDASGAPLKFLTYDFNEWKAKGLDVHSIIADPLFDDLHRGKFTCKTHSPAFKLY